MECYICLEKIETDIATLNCGHKYHFDCISKWINKKNDWRNVCTICTNIETEIVSIENITETKETEEHDTRSLFSCCKIF